MKPFAIAALQLQVSATQNNLPHLSARLAYLMQVFPWVQMVVFSELAAYGAWTGKAETLPGHAERVFQDMAAYHKLWLINGSVFELKDGKTFNTASVIGPDGAVVTRYRKMFPFLPYEMDVQPGDGFCVFDVPDVGRFGVSICYDMWFPETSRTLAAMGAEVLLHPTLTTTIDRDVEQAMVRATAAMNQCFVVDVNGVGDGGNGKSSIVGPAGDVLHQAGSSEELIPIEIDFDRVRRSREVGVRGLGQPLKSFRDCNVPFTVYQGDAKARQYLHTLGSLVKPQRGSRAGIERAIDPPQPTPPLQSTPPPVLPPTSSAVSANPLATVLPPPAPVPPVSPQPLPGDPR